MAAQPSHPLGALWFTSHCLRWLLASTPGCHSGLAGHCCHYSHLLLMVKWCLFDCQNLMIPKHQGSQGRGCIFSHPFPTEDNTLIGFSEMPGSSCLGHSSLKGVSWGSTVRWWLVSHLIIPSSGCQCSPGISSPFPAGQYQVQVLENYSNSTWRGGGGVRCFTKMLIHTLWECAPCQQTSLYPTLYSDPSRCTISVSMIKF